MEFTRAMLQAQDEQIQQAAQLRQISVMLTQAFLQVRIMVPMVALAGSVWSKGLDKGQALWTEQM